MSTLIDQPPAWVADAVFYQIFPDRFARSATLPKPSNLEPWDTEPTVHGYKGGDLIGVIERLDYLQDLGINALYFNPIFQSAANHRYHTHDFYRVDPLLGGDEAFERLLAACHDRGMRLVLDGVFNHASRGFYQFNDILENGAKSPWIDWFHIHGWPLRAYDPDAPANYTAWWGLHALPKLNTDNPQVREYIMEIAEHWIRRGIDGWRLDVPEEISTPGFWEEFRRRVRAINPDAYIVGEIWGPASEWVNAGTRFDGVMNYQFTGFALRYVAGHRVVDEVVEGITYEVRPPKDAGSYADSVDHLYDIYSPAAMGANLNLLGSHDTPRVLTVVGEDRDSVILAALLQFTFPGAPCVYYGDEIGLRGERDPLCRGTIPWNDEPRWDKELADAHRTLIALRHAHPALRHGDYTRLWPPPTEYGDSVYVFERSIADERLLVTVNSSDTAESVAVPYDAQGPLVTAWGEGGVNLAGRTLRLALNARSGAVWTVG